MENAVSIIQNIGFPIFCVLALGFFIYKAYIRISEDNKEREEKLYTMLASSQNQIDEAIKTNSNFVKQLEIMQNNVQSISDDVDEIKDFLKIRKEV